MRKLAFSLAAMVLLVSSCGKPKTESVHQKLLSMYPQYIVTKAFQTNNNLFIYSFDVKAMKEKQQIASDSPQKVGHELALVTAWDFPKDEEFKCENPSSFEGFSSCLYYDMQVFTPVLDYSQYMKKNGAISEQAGNGFVYSIKTKDAKEKPVTIESSADSNAVVSTKSSKQPSQNAATMIVSGQDKPITEYESVQTCLRELEGYPAIVIGFLTESFAVKSDYKAIVSPAKSPTQIIGMQDVFKRWGRNEFVSNSAFGSKWANGVETVKTVFVYQNQEKAQEDFETLSRDIAQIPSFLTGDSWYKRMNMTTPQLGIEGSVVTIEFDMDKKSGSFQFPLLMRNIEKTGDWGWLWLK